jgi:hypothetical protein
LETPPPASCGSVFIFLKFLLLKISKLVLGLQNLDMTSEVLGEMFGGDTADTCAGKFPLVSMGDRDEGLACADPGARTPIGASGNLFSD